MKRLCVCDQAQNRAFHPTLAAGQEQKREYGDTGVYVAANPNTQTDACGEMAWRSRTRCMMRRRRRTPVQRTAATGPP